MIKSRYFKDKEYATKEELFKDLKDNQELLIDAKKSEIQKSCDKGESISCKTLDLLKFTDQLKGIKIDDNYYYIAVNSTKILDSHDDLHVDGIWKKSVKEIQGKNYLVADHELELMSVLARKEHIEIFTAKVPFSLIGKPYDGDTEVLIYKIAKVQIKNDVVKEWLDSGDSIEASVRMQYVTILLALDSNSPDDAIEKKNYDDYIDTIANKSDFEYIPYFFVIKEAKNVKESSLVVFGSNSSTGQINNNKQAEKSLKKINIKMEQNTDIMFIDEMIPHHEIAIEMSKKAKPDIKNKELKNIVSNIIKNQKEEIEEMKKIKKDIEAVTVDTSESKQEPTQVTQTKRRRNI